MSKCIDLVGQVFGRWTVVARRENDNWGGPMWLCACICGNEKVVQGGHLKNGNTSSCGCLNREIAAACNTTHGLSKNPWYKKAVNIKYSITNPKAINYEYYGGRGLLLHEPWHNIAVFVKDLEEMFGPCPPRSAGLSIGRIDNNIGYFPDNIRLATSTEQALNKRPRKGGTSQFRGVFWDKATQKWRAQVQYQKKNYPLGRFTTEEQAAKARDAYIIANNWPHPLNFKKIPKTLDKEK